MTDWLFEIGPTVATMAGAERIGWRDLAAWQEISGIELLPVEARLLRRLSAEYADERHEAKAPDRPPPYGGEKQDVIDRRAMVERKLDAVFAGLKKKE